MFIEERLEKIIKLLNERGKLSVHEVNKLLRVSEDTIRRDFKRLSKMGMVIRTHGGIMSKRSVSFDPTLKERIIKNHKEKILIAKKAVTLINDSETIILDAGTTTEEIAKLLQNYKNLTILTDALNIAVNTVKYSNIKTILFGGEIRNTTLSVIGPDAVDMIKHYHADKLFLAASAISIDKGLMTPSIMEAEIKKELINRANRIIVVADSSKIDATALYSFCSINYINTFVTDFNAEKEFINELRNLSINVLIAEE
ncbi:MAG: DeoR/GlpR family DNA-binding transcription regulator [Promethearchaeota archaeon]